jgi:quercetin dioxygenase-like cupin family protein
MGMMAHDTVHSPTLRQQVRFFDRPDHSDGDVLRIEVTQEPGPIVPPHVHPAQEERFHVLEGEISLRIGRRRVHLRAGEDAAVPAGTAHSFRVRGDRTARLMNEFRPPLRTDDCFVETFELDRATAPVVSKLERLTRIAQEYPREFLFYAPGIPWERQRLLLERLAAAVSGLAGDRGGAKGGSDNGTVSAGRGLAVYMNDQLAAGVLWREVARRAARENRGTEAEPMLSRLAGEIAQDVERFRDIMRRLKIPERRGKTAAAVVAERLGRLKLNGRLLGYSPLSRFVELDFLAMGIEGKKILWANLRDLAHLHRALADVSFDELINRAEEQRRLIEPLRQRAGEDALELAGPVPDPGSPGEPPARG